MSETTLALVGDIGGTNARFALTDLSSPTVELLEAKSLPNADFASVQHAMEHYLSGVSAKPARVALVPHGRGRSRGVGHGISGRYGRWKWARACWSRPSVV